LILGGVRVPYAKGLLGHSDADVLAHAIADALLGATSQGDIGRHFPDTDSRYAGADSLVLLSAVVGLVRGAGWEIENVDAVVVAQAPKLAPFIDAMTDNLARDMGVSGQQVGVKATTTEGLGFAGRGEGIAAQAVVLVRRLG
jgi:2-C-methyl-D-erythritol 2,4-cyclodiphosphate synthase